MDKLYQDQILELASLCKEHHFNECASFLSSCNNPICGDRVDVSLEVYQDRIKDIGLKILGCAICEAGAGLMIKQLTGITPNCARKKTKELKQWVKREGNISPDTEMLKFTPLLEIKNRHKCFLLPFEAAVLALDNNQAYSK